MSTGSPPLRANRIAERSTSVSRREYLPIRPYAMFGAAVSVARLSVSQCTQLNGAEANAVVGACQVSVPPRRR